MKAMVEVVKLAARLTDKLQQAHLQGGGKLATPTEQALLRELLERELDALQGLRMRLSRIASLMEVDA